MKKNSIFINTSRGEIVDEISLIKALKSKKLNQQQSMLFKENKKRYYKK